MADKPSFVVEVLSPTTGGFDLTVKLAEYQDLPSLDFILFVDTESPTVHLYRRDADRRWQDAVLKGLDAVVELEKPKISVPLRDIYEGTAVQAETEAGAELAGGRRARRRVQIDLTKWSTAGRRGQFGSFDGSTRFRIAVFLRQVAHRRRRRRHHRLHHSLRQALDPPSS
jgi:hypothetical protein